MLRLLHLLRSHTGSLSSVTSVASVAGSILKNAFQGGRKKEEVYFPHCYTRYTRYARPLASALPFWENLFPRPDPSLDSPANRSTLATARPLRNERSESQDWDIAPRSGGPLIAAPFIKPCYFFSRLADSRTTTQTGFQAVDRPNPAVPHLHRFRLIVGHEIN